MLRDVTLGRYFRGDSFLHLLAPGTKLLGLLFFIVSVFLSSSAASASLCLVCLVLLIVISKVPVRHMLKGTLPMFIAVLIVCVINALTAEDGLRKAVLLFVRIYEVVLASNLLTLTTRPREISAGVEKALGWSSKIGVPVHDVATIVSVAFRFIPLIADEASRIMDAQICRGADYRKGGLIAKARASVSVIVPVFASSVRRSEDLAMAMDSRLYGSAEPTHLREIRNTYRDAAAYVCIFTFLTIIILMKVGRL